MNGRKWGVAGDGSGEKEADRVSFLGMGRVWRDQECSMSAIRALTSSLAPEMVQSATESQDGGDIQILSVLNS